MDLEQFFRENHQGAVAFSGGTDSSYLLYAAKHAGVDVRAYFVFTAFQPQFERDDAERMARELDVPLRVLPLDILSCDIVSSNPPNRCYYCKTQIMSAIRIAAEKDGIRAVWDGTNASDHETDRPGMLALRELSIRSPLKECGLTKKEIRVRSHEAGLFTWNKPAYACLATRIPQGEIITREKLDAAEAAEMILFSLGFSDLRVRKMGDAARIQVPAAQMEAVVSARDRIVRELKKYYSAVVLDLEARP